MRNHSSKLSESRFRYKHLEEEGTPGRKFRPSFELNFEQMFKAPMTAICVRLNNSEQSDRDAWSRKTHLPAHLSDLDWSLRHTKHPRLRKRALGVRACVRAKIDFIFKPEVGSLRFRAKHPVSQTTNPQRRATKKHHNHKLTNLSGRHKGERSARPSLTVVVCEVDSGAGSQRTLHR